MTTFHYRQASSILVSCWILLLVQDGSAWGLSSRTLSIGSPTKSTSLYASNGDGVMDFVKSLDSAMGNPTAYSAAEAAASNTPTKAIATATAASTTAASSGAVSMSIPNSLVIAGGSLAVTFFLGLAFFLFQNNKPDKGTNGTESAIGNTIESEGLVAASVMNKTPPASRPMEYKFPSTDEGRTIESEENEKSEASTAQTMESEKEEEESEAVEASTVLADESVADPVVNDDETEIVDSINTETEPVEDPSAGLLSKLKAKLLRKTEELEEVEGLLADERKSRQDSESKLQESEQFTVELQSQLDTNQKSLQETTEKYEYTKSELERQMEERKELESELKNIAETNRVLEDKYELEQNALSKAKLDLSTTRESLEKTEGRLKRTQGELTRVHSDLLSTVEKLDSTQSDLDALRKEDESVRLLGSKMWHLSRTKVKNRFQRVKDRIQFGRGRRRKSHKKRKNLF